MKKFLLILFVFLLVGCDSNEKQAAVSSYGNLAQELVGKGDKKVKVYVFAKDGCSACANADEYFNNLSEDKEYNKMFDYNYIQIYDSSWNPVDLGLEALMLDVATFFKDEFDGTPYIVVGEKGFDGYLISWEELFEKEIKRCYEADKCVDPVEKILKENK